MLNLSKIKQNSSKLNISKDKAYFINETRHFPPASKEWFNSVYAYNKKNTKLLPLLDISVLKLIRSYFSMYSKNLEKKVKTPRLRMWMRRSSIKRILVSKAELKHTNEKVTIVLHIFNRQKTYYLNKMQDLSILTGNSQNASFKDKIETLRTKGLELLSNIEKIKKIFFNTLDWKNSEFVNFEKKVYKNYLKKSLKREILFLYYKQILFVNNAKFKSTYIIPFKSLIEKLYKKKVEFNLISLKYFHLNSDIYLQMLMLKLRNRKSRILRVLKRSLAKIRLPRLIKLISLSDIYINKHIKVQNPSIYNLTYNPLRERSTSEGVNFKDILTKALNEYSVNDYDFSTLKGINNVLGTIRNKTFSGIRVEASGRLTKRITAARTLSKLKYVGNLKNIDSSFKSASSVIFRGNIKSNLNFMKAKSKTRIGSYGLKSWINNL